MRRVTIFGLLALSLTLQAAPVRPKQDSIDEIKKKLALNEKLLCIVEAAIFKEDKDGNQTGETEEILLFSGKPQKSSSSDLATYMINYQDEKIAFRYSMNTQSGLITVTDKKSGANATAYLEINDLVNKSYQVGPILIENNKKLKLLGRTESVQLDAYCRVQK